MASPPKFSNLSFKCKKSGHWYKDCPEDEKRVESNLCFKCKKNGHWYKDCHENEKRLESNLCFKCKKSGHWYKDCPENEKRLSLSSSESSSSSSLSPMEVPIVQCPCGNGACKISTSHTKKNPDKKFYSCSNKCGFFVWVDDVAEFGAPLCPCGAGVCSLNRDENGCWFFACRIKKGHGACPFFQWANVNSKMNKHLHRSTGCVLPQDENSEAVIKPSQSPRKDSQPSSGISEDHSRCQNYNTRQNDSSSSSIFKNFGQGLLNILEDESLVDLEKMLTIAETAFVALRSLSINISSFSEYVMNYIDCKSRLATLENSMRKSLSSQELENIFNSKDACYQRIARQLTERKAEYEAVESHFQYLTEEFSRMKNEPHNLQEELECFQAKTLELKTSLLKIECEMSVSKRSMEAARLEMNEAISMEKERKRLQHEARTSLESAKAELSSESYVCVNRSLLAPVKNGKYAAFYVYALVPVVAFALCSIGVLLLGIKP